MNYYIGLSLASNSTTDSGVAVLDENNKIIKLDKLYKMNDVIHFFENFPSLNNSKICVSVPNDKTMLDGKWRILGKQYLPVATNKNIPNRDNWTQRRSARGSEYLNNLSERGISITRFDVYISRQSLHLNSCYKDRSPADCKFLQQALRAEWGFEDIPTNNMMPVSHLEAIIGAIIAKENVINPKGIRKLYNFKGLEVIDVNTVLNLSTDIYDFGKKLTRSFV